MILGPNFGRDRTLPFKRMVDVQPQSPPTRTPIGRTPWRVVTGDKDTAVLKDRDGNTLCTVVSLELARIIATAVNSFAPLNAEWGMLTDVLKALQADLRTGTAEEANKRAQELIDGVLTPKETTPASAKGTE